MKNQNSKKKIKVAVIGNASIGGTARLVANGAGLVVVESKKENQEGLNKRLAFNKSMIEPQLGEQQESFREDDGAMYFLFRHISAAIVGGGTWKATDFSEGSVLQDSVPLLDDVPAYKNHYYSIGMGIGRVVEPIWQMGYTNDKGMNIPAGINAYFKIPKVDAYDELLGVLTSTANPYDSASVGVSFEWKASHEFEDSWDFWYHLGETIVDDEGNESMVRRIVTKVNYYLESSLVPFGADEYAKKAKDEDGNYNAVEPAKTSEFGLNLNAFDSKENFLKFKKDSGNWKKEQEAVNLGSEKNNSKPESMENEKFIALLLPFLGFDSLEGLEEESLQESLSKLKKGSSTEELDRLQSEIESYRKKVESKDADLKVAKESLSVAEKLADKFSSEIEANKAKIDFANEERTQRADFAKKLYLSKMTSLGKEPDTAMLEKLEKATIEDLNFNIEILGGETGLSASCQKCGGTNISLKASLREENPTLGVVIPELPNPDDIGV